MKYMKLIVLLATILALKSTAFTQTSSDSTKCFSYEQARHIANRLKKAYVCDSMVQNMHLQIINYRSVVDQGDEIIRLNESHIKDQSKKINALGLKLNISKRLTILGVPTAFVGGFIAAVLISK